MATLSELEEAGAIVLIDVLGDDELPWRLIYGTPAFIEWMNDILPSLPSTTVGAQLTSEEQVYASFDEYVSGEPFNDDRRFKSLRSTPDHFVWEFKTDDVRVFGWVAKQNCFIATFGDLKDEIELKRLYGKYIAQTVFVRDNLDLDEPKYLTGKDYADVISNKAA